MLAWDTETALIEEAKLAPELACITFSDGNSQDIVHWKDPGAYRCARWLLEQETTTANGPYDLGVIWAQFPDLRDLIWEALAAGRIHDVQTRQKLMDIGAGNYRRVFKRFQGEDKARLLRYSLHDLYLRYFGISMEKDEFRLRYGEFRKIPLEQWPPGAIKYATFDAVATSRIHVAQDEAAHPNGLLNNRSNLHDEINQVQAHFALHLMSCWGFKADLKQVEKVILSIEEEQPALTSRLQALVRNRAGKMQSLVRPSGGKPHVRNERLAKELMYAAVGDAGELTKTGYKRVKAGELTKQQALYAGYIKIDEEWCEISGFPSLIDYYHFRQNQLLRSKLENIRAAATYGLPVQTSFEILMETGRTSSSENKIISNSMALQNPPRKGGLRECLISRTGWTLVACDYGQAELVSLAQVTYAAFGYSVMRDLINAGRDIHVDFGAQVMGSQIGRNIDYETAAKLRKAKGGADKQTGELYFINMEEFVKEQKKNGLESNIILLSDMRQLAKAADFGFPGGLGWQSFQSYARKAWDVELSAEQSKRLKITWLHHFPEMQDYFRWIGKLVGDGRADIQQYMSGRWRGKCYYTQSCNTLFQGLTADAAKAACFEVSRRCYADPTSSMYGCRPVLFVHDEIILEAPDEQADAAARELEKVMVEIYQRYTPAVKITADAHLMKRWSKDAEAVLDHRGKLIPWEPPQDEDERAENELAVAA
jgi:hypothetical protein